MKGERNHPPRWTTRTNGTVGMHGDVRRSGRCTCEKTGQEMPSKEQTRRFSPATLLAMPALALSQVEGSETADAWIEQQVLEEASSGAGSADTQRTSQISHQASDVDADNVTSRCGVDEDGAPPSTVESKPTGAGGAGGDAGRVESPAGLKAEDDPAGAHVESGDASRSVKSGLRPDDALSSALRGQANRRPDESFHEVETGQWRGHSPLSKSVLGAHIASPLRLELQKGMERAAQEMSQTVRRPCEKTHLPHS
jgi:hypothetical protein